MTWWQRLFSSKKIEINSPYRKAIEYHLKTKGVEIFAWQSGREIFRYPQINTDLHDIFSGSKTLIALAFLHLQEAGKLNLNDKASQYIPEFHTGNRHTITIRQLLNLTSSLEEDNTIGNILPYKTAKNAKKLKHRGFEYGATSYLVLGLIFQKVCPRQKLGVYIEKNFFTPLGITLYEWSEVAGNDTMVSWGLKLRAEDWARIGILLLQKGTYEGVELLSRQSMRLLTTTSLDNPYFGLSTWILKHGQHVKIKSKSSGITKVFTVDSFSKIIAHLRRLNYKEIIFCVGLNSQRLYIIPEKNLVIARMAKLEDFDYSDYRLIRDVVSVLESKNLK